MAVPGAGKKLIGDLHDKKNEVEEEDEEEDPSTDEAIDVKQDKVKGASEGGKGKTNEKTTAEKTRRRRRRDVSNIGKVIYYFLIMKPKFFPAMYTFFILHVIQSNYEGTGKFQVFSLD